MSPALVFFEAGRLYGILLAEALLRGVPVDRTALIAQAVARANQAAPDAHRIIHADAIHLLTAYTGGARGHTH